MPRTKHIVLGAIVVVATCAAWILFQPDEALAPALRDSFGPRNASQATIGLIGLEAPAGTDFMEHGRLAFTLASLTGGDALEVAMQLNREKPRLLPKNIEHLECWLYLPGEEMSEEISRDCATPAQLQTALDEHSELLRRYRTIQKMPVAADGEVFHGTTTIALGKLVVADIANDLRLGYAERAYRKWADNHIHQSRMAGYVGGWVRTAINMVNEGLSFSGLDLLIAKAPELIQSHREELLEIVKPRDHIVDDVIAIFRGEIRFFEQVRAELPIQRFVRANRLRNRFAAYSSDFVATVVPNPIAFAAPAAAVKARHSAWRMGDLFDPITASAWQLLMSGQVKQGELVNAMFRKEAQRRLYAIKIMRLTASVPNSSVEADMKAAPSELRSPFDGTPVRWDAGTRTLYFNIGNGERVKVAM